jgi:hypothetical protein
MRRRMALATIKQTEMSVNTIILISISCVTMSDKRQKSRKNDCFSQTIA